MVTRWNKTRIAHEYRSAAELAWPSPAGCNKTGKRFGRIRAATTGNGMKTFARLAQRIGWGRIVGLLLLAAFLALRVWDPAPVQILRLRTFDIYQMIQPREPAAQPAVIVDIDDASLQAHGQWPWPRTLVARLVEEIAKRGAVAIGFDIVFPEPDRTTPFRVAQGLPELDEKLREAMRKARDHDEILAETIARSRVVLGLSAYNPRQGARRADSSPKASFATIGADPKPFLVEYPDLLANIEPLEKAAAGRGMFTVLPDADGMIRKVPVLLLAKGNMVPSLSLDLLRVATGKTTYLIRSGANGIESMAIAGMKLPVDANGNLWLHFSPHRPDRYVSASDVIAGTVPADRFAGRLVLIGTSASGLLDLRATPVDPAMPGVEIHAQLLESILTGALLKRPDYAVGFEILLGLAIGLGIIVLAPVFGAVTVFAAGLAVAGLVVGLSWYYFSTQGLLIDITYPLLSSFVMFATMLSVTYFREEVRRRQIREAFGQYLSPDLVEQLAEHPDKLVLGGETREMSILFSDVRDFTGISESYKSDPQKLTLLINRLLTPLSNAILEQRGTIDKYMGDNVMAFWNAPLDDARHARNACAAALGMVGELTAINRQLEAEASEAGTPFGGLDVGIGINTGECVVGNMGSDVRFDYTVLGDSVNLASRLEGQSKAYGVRIIIGEHTAQLAGDEFVTAELDWIRVKGKTQPEVIYTILGWRDGADAGAYDVTRENIRNILAAYRKRDWTAAERALGTARKAGSKPDMSAFYDLYEQRVRQFRRSPPPKNWDGVYTALSK